MVCRIKRKKIYLFLFIILISQYLSKQDYQTFNLVIKEKDGEEDLDIMHYENDIDKICQKWIPSLFTPVLIVSSNIQTPDTIIKKINANIPVLSPKEKFSINIYEYNFLQKYNVLLGKIQFFYKVDECYLGLSTKNSSFENTSNTEFLLNQLVKNGDIPEKKISFDIWSINEKPIKSNLYIGNSHENFISKNDDAIIGYCKPKKSDLYWGCTFNGILFNNKILDLTKKDTKDENYTIYFSTENYDIVLPLSLESKIKDFIGQLCTYNLEDHDLEEYYFTCDSLFIERDYEEIKLLGDSMNITIEIDNKKRFYTDDNEKQHKTRIKYEDIEYFIFPLIMFKNFHIQFDAEKDLINFYTTNSSILEPVKPKDNKKGSSKGLTVFLIILIILLILGLAYGVFWLLRKRRGSIEQKINKYNKFEDEEDFQNINEKRVF